MPSVDDSLDLVVGVVALDETEEETEFFDLEDEATDDPLGPMDGPLSAMDDPLSMDGPQSGTLDDSLSASCRFVVISVATD